MTLKKPPPTPMPPSPPKKSPLKEADHSTFTVESTSTPPSEEGKTLLLKVPKNPPKTSHPTPPPITPPAASLEPSGISVFTSQSVPPPAPTPIELKKKSPDQTPDQNVVELFPSHATASNSIASDSASPSPTQKSGSNVFPIVLSKIRTWSTSENALRFSYGNWEDFKKLFQNTPFKISQKLEEHLKNASTHSEDLKVLLFIPPTWNLAASFGKAFTQEEKNIFSSIHIKNFSSFFQTLQKEEILLENHPNFSWNFFKKTLLFQGFFKCIRLGASESCYGILCFLSKTSFLTSKKPSFLPPPKAPTQKSIELKIAS